MKEYPIKIRDFDQKIVHKMSQLARSRKEAEEIALEWAKGALRTKNLAVIHS